MPFDLTLAIAVRAAGPALFAILGIVVMSLSGGRRDRLALGAFFALFGGWLVASNLGIAADSPPFFWAALVIAIGAGLAAAASLMFTSRAERPRAPALALVGLWAILVSALYIRAIPEYFPKSAFARAMSAESFAAFTTFVGFGSLFFVIALALPGAWALAALRAPPERIGMWAGLATGVQVYSAFAAGSDVLSGYNSVIFIDASTAILLVGGYAGVWLWVAIRRESRAARNVALATLAAMLAGMLRHASTGIDSAADPIGFIGLARLVGWAIVAATLIRSGWFDVAFLSRHRAELAAVALAALFIVAQVAENYVDAEYGLVMGGVVAGALLFAAAPIQRAFETTRTPKPAASTNARTARGEDSYRKALRIALRDRKLTREEETHLHELARDLGIDGPRAHALLAEVEKEGDGPARSGDAPG